MVVQRLAVFEQGLSNRFEAIPSRCCTTESDLSEDQDGSTTTLEIGHGASLPLWLLGAIPNSSQVVTRAVLVLPIHFFMHDRKWGQARPTWPLKLRHCECKSFEPVPVLPTWQRHP